MSTPSQQRAEADRSWIQKANCRGVDPSVFYPDPEVESACQEAKDICARCKVKSECLEYAVKLREPHGVWGGLTGAERRKIRRKRRTAFEHELEERSVHQLPIGHEDDTLAEVQVHEFRATHSGQARPARAQYRGMAIS